MKTLVYYSDPVTQEVQTIDLTGWRFNVTVNGSKLASMPVEVFLLQISMGIAMENRAEVIPNIITKDDAIIESYFEITTTPNLTPNPDAST